MKITTRITVGLLALALAVFGGACGGDGEESPAMQRCLSRYGDTDDGEDTCRGAADCLDQAQSSEDVDTCYFGDVISGIDGIESFTECMEFADEDEMAECVEKLEG